MDAFTSVEVHGTSNHSFGFAHTSNETTGVAFVTSKKSGVLQEMRNRRYPLISVRLRYLVSNIESKRFLTRIPV